MDGWPASVEPPPKRRPAEVESPTPPLPPPRDAESLERFIEGVAGVPREHREEIREAIGSFTGRDEVAELLHEALFALPCADIGRHGLLLSIVGELSEPSSAAALERFTWLSDEEVLGSELLREPRACDFAPSGLLQARAAEMLAWVLGTEREELVLRIIDEHPLRPVRIAAVDAYLFRREDSPEAIEALTGRMRSDDAWMVGLPRRFDGVNVEEFDRLVAEHEARHGGGAQPPQARDEGGGHVH